MQNCQCLTQLARAPKVARRFLGGYGLHRRHGDGAFDNIQVKPALNLLLIAFNSVALPMPENTSLMISVIR